ncbi:MAG: hypothetical protein GX810_02010, partial [Clostridiales bacterium]|nr:hypothetical protein [Clostridiales bacterium]
MQVRDFKSSEYREPPRARDFRRQAREALKGNWWRMALVMLVFLLLTGTQTDRSFRDESNFSVPQYTSLNLHSSVGLGPYTRTDTSPIDLSWSRYERLTLPEQLAYSFQAIWLSLPTGVRTFLIGASLVSLALALIAPALRLGLYEAMSALYRRERPRVSELFSQFHL